MGRGSHEKIRRLIEIIGNIKRVRKNIKNAAKMTLQMKMTQKTKEEEEGKTGAEAEAKVGNVAGNINRKINDKLCYVLIITMYDLISDLHFVLRVMFLLSFSPNLRVIKI